MRPERSPVEEAIVSRRSVRRFAPRYVPADIVRDLVALASQAPAPHGSQPWRFVHIASPEAKDALSDAMADAWRADLEREGQTVHTIHKLLARSRRQLDEAPILLLACLSLENARPWPDELRRRAERDMFLQSLGAALQNLLLAAHDRGLAGYLKGAPLFCPEAVAQALDLPPDWQPAFLVLLGYPAQGLEPPPRPAIRIDDFIVHR